MLVIGIVGGIASGKSIVARCLEQCGAVVLDADRAGHEVLESGEMLSALRQRWGEQVFLSNGHANRAAIAGLVFNKEDKGQQELRFLEGLTHPRIRVLLENRIAELRRGSQVPAVVLDAPLMFEAGWNTLCDYILFVDAPRDVRLQRAQEQRGWTDEQFAAREAAQRPVEWKRQQSDVVIDNSGSMARTEQQVRDWWSKATRAETAED